MPQCPRCDLRMDDVTLAVHLMMDHDYKYEKAMDWIHSQEEKCVR